MKMKNWLIPPKTMTDSLRKQHGIINFAAAIDLKLMADLLILMD